MKKDKIKILRMSEEDQKLLASLSDRFSITQSEVIRRALKVFAAKTKHNITLCYREPIRKLPNGTTEINIASDDGTSWDEINNFLDGNEKKEDEPTWDELIERLSK